MEAGDELIALVIDEPAGTGAAGGDSAADSTGAHRLIRAADGRVALEPVESQADFERLARDTGCFRRGRPIRDPKTHAVIGYELEEFSGETTAARG